MFFKRKISQIVILATFFSANAAFAEENLWVYTTGTDVRPAGSFEARFSARRMSGKSSGEYERFDIRPGIEYGITDRLTVGATALIFKHNYSVDNPDLQPMYDTQGGDGGSYNHMTLGGFRLMSKYNILSPYKDPLGLSVGFVYEKRERYRLDGSNINQATYMPRIFLQKNWLDDRLTLALVQNVELERRKGEGQVLEEEIALETNIGISYRFKPKHFVGFEFRRQADYLNPSEMGVKDEEHKSSNFDLHNMRLGSNHQYGMYIRPSYHYAEQNWWYTIGALWQIAGSGSKNSINGDGKNWDEHERLHLGFSWGYNW